MKKEQIFAKSNYGNSALDATSSQGYKEIVEFLLENGSDIYTKDNVGMTALI